MGARKMSHGRSIKDHEGTVWYCELTGPVCEHYATDSSIADRNVISSEVTLSCQSSDGKTLSKLIPGAKNESIDTMDESWLVKMIEEAKKEGN
jgi:hypothetical protein